jgi:3-hydroxyacyl-[acyl-carrier-protein] dehydratase
MAPAEPQSVAPAVQADFIDANGLMRILPHRYPFLLVDRVTACEPGQYIVGLKNVTSSEFSGMPRLLVVEALAQLSVVLAYKTLGITPDGTELMFFAGIDDARFGATAYPGDRLDLRCSVSRIKRQVGRFMGEAWVEDRQVVAVSMLAAIRTT